VRNIRLLIAYDGTAYAGWQRQAVQPTIQGLLEQKITLMTKAPITLHGAGRTDAGVHALGMVANFHTDSTIPCSGFMMGLNSMLPEDIRILRADEVAVDFQSRFQAKGKIYVYQFICAPILLPHQRLYYAHIPGSLDLPLMEKALSSLIGEHDFASFEASGSRDLTLTGGRGSVRRIVAASLQQQGDGWAMVIHGDGFLRHMVRNIAGSVFEVGKGKRTLADFQKIVAAKDRSQAGTTAPAKGLFLREVFY
jgi:tRNA pseudouridine38-40 synthase